MSTFVLQAAEDNMISVEAPKNHETVLTDTAHGVHISFRELKTKTPVSAIQPKPRPEHKSPAPEDQLPLIGKPPKKMRIWFRDMLRAWLTDNNGLPIDTHRIRKIGLAAGINDARFKSTRMPVRTAHRSIGMLLMNAVKKQEEYLIGSHRIVVLQHIKGSQNLFSLAKLSK